MTAAGARHEPAASAYLISTRQLPRRAGSLLEVRRTVPVLPDMGSDVIGFRQGEDLELEVRCESVTEGILVTGTIAGTAYGQCVRCLQDTTAEILAPLQELFFYPERAAAALEAGDDEDELRIVEGDELDLESAVRDNLIPALPFQPLCREDCAGLCPECGVRLDDDPGHHHESLDPRWSALAGLLGEEEDNGRRIGKAGQ